MPQAIETKYFPPTDDRSARIKAECAAGSVTVSYPYELDIHKAHRFAAAMLCDKLGGNNYGWNIAKYSTGQLKNGNYVHVPTY